MCSLQTFDTWTTVLNHAQESASQRSEMRAAWLEYHKMFEAVKQDGENGLTVSTSFSSLIFSELPVALLSKPRKSFCDSHIQQMEQRGKSSVRARSFYRLGIEKGLCPCTAS